MAASGRLGARPASGLMAVRRGQKWRLTALVVVLAMVGLAEPAQAAPDTPGVSITPFYTELNIVATDVTVPLAVTLTNRSGVDLRFTLSAVDFGSLDEEGGVAFLGQSASELEHKYGLAAWMKLDQAEIVVAHGQSAQVKGRIENRTTLSPGGHYGAILATALTDDASGAAAAQVGVRQVVSSLLLVAKEGGNAYKLVLESQQLGGGWWRLPSDIDQRYSNQGNVHIVPRGTVEVMDPFGRVVRRGALNEASGTILPGAVRHMRTELSSVEPAWLPGPYRVVTHYRPDTLDTTTQHVQVVWYAGALVMWVLVLAVVLVVWGMVWWAWWRPRSLRQRVAERRSSTR